MRIFLFMSPISRKYSLNSRESISFFLRDGVKMLQDDFDSKILHHILQNYSYFLDKLENEVLIDYIIAQGIICIQGGHHPFVMKKMLGFILA